MLLRWALVWAGGECVTWVEIGVGCCRLGCCCSVVLCWLWLVIVLLWLGLLWTGVGDCAVGVGIGVTGGYGP